MPSDLELAGSGLKTQTATCLHFAAASQAVQLKYLGALSNAASRIFSVGFGFGSSFTFSASGTWQTLQLKLSSPSSKIQATRLVILILVDQELGRKVIKHDVRRFEVFWFETSLYQGGRATRPPTFCLDLNQGGHEVQLFL